MNDKHVLLLLLRNDEKQLLFVMSNCEVVTFPLDPVSSVALDCIDY